MGLGQSACARADVSLEGSGAEPCFGRPPRSPLCRRAFGTGPGGREGTHGTSSAERAGCAPPGRTRRKAASSDEMHPALSQPVPRDSRLAPATGLWATKASWVPDHILEWRSKGQTRHSSARPYLASGSPREYFRCCLKEEIRSGRGASCHMSSVESHPCRSGPDGGVRTGTDAQGPCQSSGHAAGAKEPASAREAASVSGRLCVPFSF